MDLLLVVILLKRYLSNRSTMKVINQCCLYQYCTNQQHGRVLLNSSADISILILINVQIVVVVISLDISYSLLLFTLYTDYTIQSMFELSRMVNYVQLFQKTAKSHRPNPTQQETRQMMVKKVTAKRHHRNLTQQDRGQMMITKVTSLMQRRKDIAMTHQMITNNCL